ncbi:hypothetical protein [Beggiatoa leptomitoformis]|uniref:DUF3862 domain-containing protein n=1 Tax=Beggiatoa leptomitoformis TaxID=288004 RepID=A0A650GDT0_9GAMM|nr:hypothetical protein [Beggiatoa leptomitoformis]QGX03641.1 hypothetical protein AL038_18825 [Beggiatoa leptomitoformis]QGX04076.1 hypothetical protein BLE401_18590 [Beggiatoa leptomitoformis]
MGRFRKAINTIFGIAILGGISYYTYNFASAESRIRAVCAEIQQGMTTKELQAFALTHGLSSFKLKESGINYVVETKTYGRFGCKVITESGFIKESEYNFAD